MKTLRDTVDALSQVSIQNLRNELDDLEAIREWAMEQLDVDYRPGDRVTINAHISSLADAASGWYAYREALAPGQEGTAGDIQYDRCRKRWYVLVGMDRTWSVHERGWGPNTTQIRFWNGPAAETPDGYEPPSQHDQEHHPDGKIKHFYMDVTWLAKAPTTPEQR
ncbi:hypothetical protein ACUXZZ_45270 (plasmid) [Streptomyces graminifolii]|uniref:hypothetical protein n=1 Tax=Streptomyces graminifolii TaxID=1266771 RepID=UPI00405891EF